MVMCKEKKIRMSSESLPELNLANDSLGIDGPQITCSLRRKTDVSKYQKTTQLSK